MPVSCRKCAAGASIICAKSWKSSWLLAVLMLRQPGSSYEAGRSSTLLKVKRFHDAEARVLEHQPGLIGCADANGVRRRGQRQRSAACVERAASEGERSRAVHGEGAARAGVCHQAVIDRQRTKTAGPARLKRLRPGLMWRLGSGH